MIVQEGKLLCIDLVESLEMIHDMKRDDVRLLIRSILWISGHEDLEEKLKKLIQNYGESPSRENIERLVKEVNKHLKRKLSTLKRYGHIHSGSSI
jgi:hypothetical protein